MYLFLYGLYLSERSNTVVTLWSSRWGGFGTIDAAEIENGSGGETAR